MYNPKFSSVEAETKHVLKWKLPEQEHQFFYEHNGGFKHNIDIDLAKEASDSRVKALKKLYFEYKNKETFTKGKRLMREMAVHKIAKYDSNSDKGLENPSILSSYTTAKRRFDPYSQHFTNVLEPNIRSNSISGSNSYQKLRENPRLISKLKPSNLQSMKSFNEGSIMLSDDKHNASI